MNAFLDAIDLSSNIARGLAAIRGVRGLNALILAVALTLTCVALAPLIWFFDVGSTVTYTSQVTEKIAPTIPEQYGQYISLIVLSITLLPTLVELFGSRLAAVGIRVAAGLVYLFSVFDAITDWPRVQVFMEGFRSSFDGLGVLSMPAFWLVRLLFLFMASFGFEVMFCVCAVCALALFINSRYAQNPTPFQQF